MRKVSIREEEFELENKDVALIYAIKDLTQEIRRLANK